MHYYKFHLGDYIKATVHLSNEEDLAYRRLLDFYYETEKEIPLETQWVSRRLRVGIESVEFVLNEFFMRTENGYFHSRCYAEITKYHADADKNRENGKLGGRPKKTQSVPSGNPVETQTKPNQKATINHKPITNSKPIAQPEGFAEFWKAYPKKVDKADAIKAFAKADADLSTLLAAVAIQSKSQQWISDNGKYIPHPATWLNKRRWEAIESTNAQELDPVYQLLVKRGHTDIQKLSDGRWRGGSSFYSADGRPEVAL